MKTMTERELLEYVKRRQDDDWGRLAEAIRSALNGYWSINCSGVLNQIRQGIEITGPSDPMNVPWELVRESIYTLVTGVEVDDFIEEYRELMDRHLGERRLPIAVYHAVKAELAGPVRW